MPAIIKGVVEVDKILNKLEDLEKCKSYLAEAQQKVTCAESDLIVELVNVGLTKCIKLDRRMLSRMMRTDDAGDRSAEFLLKK